MLALSRALGREKAVLWGTTGARVVWSLASHHPDNCHAVANRCGPYFPKASAPPAFFRSLIARRIPAGQWEYRRFYEENFGKACCVFDADIRATVNALFRKGRPDGKHRPARTAHVRKDGGCSAARERHPTFRSMPMC
jgi:pimeloyl-ACP methyl ester carboxylesterase